jgi:hypothetical protein
MEIDVKILPNSDFKRGDASVFKQKKRNKTRPTPSFM